VTTPLHRDWQAWHDIYDEPGGPLARRLAAVQGLLAAALDDAPAGPITLISVCAGQARDVLGVVPGHARAADVRGRLVELDERNARIARDGLRAAGLTGLDVVEADAGTTDAYAGVAPADVVLVCGVFGNVTDTDIRRTVAGLPALCRPGTTVLWTRHRRAPDLTPALRGWFAEESFRELDIVAPRDVTFTVGSCRYAGPPRPFRAGERLFSFVR
jgi:hypothetical protein